MKRIEAPSGEIALEYEVMARAAEKNALRSAPPLAMVDTYGCQQNEADSELLRGMLSRMGYGFTEDEFAADVVVVNTCAVREHAEMRILGNVGALSHAKRAKPSMVIAMCGCMAQQEGVAEKIKSSYTYVDLVFGTHELRRFPELLERVLEGRKRRRVFAVTPSDGEVVEGLPVRRGEGVKAWLSVMYGCNNFCSYCIVPYVRGRERSRRPENILADARELAGAGYKDITLLGQNVNSYGRDLGGTDFAELLGRVCAIDGDFVVRFMTSHPKDATPRLFEAMAASPKAANHLHLPFQAGSSRVLGAMNRGYTREGYIALTERARKTVPGLVLTSDVIVGFPGETEAEFEETLELVKRVRFDSLFTFIYSPRPGTPAAELPDPFTRAQKQARFDRLLRAQNRISAEKQAEYVGTEERVLIDGAGEGDYNLVSRTRGGRLVHLKGEAGLIGSFARARITSSTTWGLFGEIV